MKFLFKNKMLLIIIFFIIFNLTVFIKYIGKDGSVEFKEIKSRFTYHELEIPNPIKIEVSNINNSIVSDKTIYLTFDDGPSYLTESILNILKEENIPATFFVTSKQIDKYGFTIKRMVKENHTVALHTSTHNYSYVYASEENYFNDLKAIRNEVYRLTGIKSRIVRLPGGSSNTVSRKYNMGVVTRIVSTLNGNNYYYFDWNVDSEDASGSLSKEQIYQNVTTRLKSGTNIILMHDAPAKHTTMEALRDIIKYGQNNGYTFSKITKDTPQIHHHINN